MSRGTPTALFATVQSRDQRTLRVLSADTTTGATTTVAEDHDDTWVDLVAGAPVASLMAVS